MRIFFQTDVSIRIRISAKFKALLECENGFCCVMSPRNVACISKHTRLAYLSSVSASTCVQSVRPQQRSNAQTEVTPASRCIESRGTRVLEVMVCSVWRVGVKRFLYHVDARVHTGFERSYIILHAVVVLFFRSHCRRELISLMEENDGPGHTLIGAVSDVHVFNFSLCAHSRSRACVCVCLFKKINGPCICAVMVAVVVSAAAASAQPRRK